MKFALNAYSLVMTSLRRITAVSAGLTLLTTLLASCGSDPATEEGPAEGTIAITDANTFTSSASLMAGSMMTAAAGANVSVCWGAPAPEDLLCHLETVKTLFLIRVAETNRDEILRLIVAGELDDHIDGSPLRYKNADADMDKCATLAEFTDGDDPVQIDSEYFASTEYTYLLVYSAGVSAGGAGTVSMTFLEPGAGTSSVQAPNGCGQLTYTVELETLTPVAVPAAGPWPIDWRGLTRTGDGREVPFTSIDRVMLAFYPGKTLPDLEMSIFDLEQLEGAKYWEIPLTGERNTDLSLAKERGTGAAFPGFTTAAAGATGTWMLALMCDTCASPAPIMLTVLTPTG
ncbi:MAG TPA: hypothetical protein VFU02_19415 [Polyangiaceae bacterium]|nr:hypothetical protein [Polyangiaceae bacterium]